ncbi:MAG TPA: hypothetical protein VGN20_10355 [Mucilaginibacter sp.]|jgi:hypothetical protein
MKQQQIHLSPYNKKVREAYFQILKEAKAILATSEHEELRYSLVREEKGDYSTPSVIHEFLNPIIYLRLEFASNELYVIHYGFEQINGDKELSNRTASFTRTVYRLTSKELTGINIEACVSNSWCITNCSGLYEYIEERNKYHQFKPIKYKPASLRRKRMQAVA